MQRSTIIMTAVFCACLATPALAQIKPATNPTTRATQTKPASSTPATRSSTATTKPIASSAAAKPPTSAPTDLSQILRDLANPATHDKALAQAKKLPASAIVPLGDAFANPATSPSLKTDIQTALDDIYARARADRQADEKKLASNWATDTGLGFYLKSGRHPQWDSMIQQAILQAQNHNAEALISFQSALNAGCRDPLIRQSYILAQADFGKITITEMLEQMQDVRNDMNASTYPASRKLGTNMFFLRYAMGPHCPPHITEDQKMDILRIAIQQFSGMATDHPTRALTKEFVLSLYSYACKFQSDRNEPAFNDVFPQISKTLPNNALTCLLQTTYYTDWAWEARGGGWASSVNNDGWKLFDERLNKAKEFADKGWRLDPLEPDIPAQRITVCMGLGEDDEIMELWFSRAMNADPHCLNACMAKGLYLQPKWHGSEKEAMEFGRWCVAHGDGNDRIPTVLLNIYAELGRYGQSDEETDSAVWTDIKSAFEKLLADKTALQSNRARYLRDRANYLKAAVDAKQWKEVAALMKKFGTDIDIEAFGGQALYDYSRKKAETETANP